MSFSNDTLFSIYPQLIAAEVGGEEVILHLESGIYYGLNPVGSRIWALLQEPRTFSQILETLLAEYDVDATRCQQDLEQILSQLVEAQLIAIQTASGADAPVAQANTAH